MGPAERMFPLDFPDVWSWGWLDTGAFIPDFLEFRNSTIDLGLNITLKRAVFPLPIGQDVGLAMESFYIYYGTFEVTTQEFFHLGVMSRQDDVEMIIGVVDAQDRVLMQGYIEDGDATMIPFRTTGPGTYRVLISKWAEFSDLTALNLRLDAVVPEEITFDEAVEGALEGSELVLQDSENIVHQEKVPAAHTYKISTDSNQPGRLSYSFNYPEIIGITPAVEPRILIFAPSFGQAGYQIEYLESLGDTGGSYHYLSWVDEPYYVTVIGSDNTQYTLTNTRPSASLLPINQGFFLQNMESGPHELAYVLHLGQDSVLRANRSSIVGAAYGWEISTVLTDGLYRELQVSVGTDFDSATTYYLPAGTYLVRAYSAASGDAGLYEFNIGPVVEGEGGVSVDVGRPVAIRVGADNLAFYRANLTLTTHDNVTVTSDFEVLNTYGGSVYSASPVLGNRHSGTQWVAYGANTTSYELGTDDSSYSMLCDGVALLVISPVSAVNNTAGPGGNTYHDYAADFLVTFEDFNVGTLNTTNAVNLGTTSVWSNFTLGDPGDVTRLYALRVNCTRGTWMNLSVYLKDASSWTAYAYQNVSGHPQTLKWNALDDTLTGSTGSWASFQIGSVSDQMLIVFKVSGMTTDEGELNIQITPFFTNQLDYPAVPTYSGYSGGGGNWLAANGLVVAGVAAVAVVALVIVVLVLKKRGH